MGWGGGRGGVARSHVREQHPKKEGRASRITFPRSLGEQGARFSLLLVANSKRINLTV